MPSLTETLFALGLGEHVVARTGLLRPSARRGARACRRSAARRIRISARLASCAPTHLIVNVDENRREDVDAARAFVPHVIVTHPMAPEDNPRLYRLFGAIFDREREAAALVEALRPRPSRALDAAVAALPRERVLYLIWRKPWMTVARDTYVSRDAGARRAGHTACASARRYPGSPTTTRAWRDADRILLSTEPYAFRERDAAALAARLEQAGRR